MLEVNYVSKAQVLDWVDGDTVDLEVDLWFRFYARMRFRLNGIDTPERGKPGYKEATKFNEEHAPVDSFILIQSMKPSKSDRYGADKYGRYLIDIQLPDGRILNDLLVEVSLAVPYDGGTKSPSNIEL